MITTRRFLCQNYYNYFNIHEPLQYYIYTVFQKIKAELTILYSFIFYILQLFKLQSIFGQEQNINLRTFINFETYVKCLVCK